MREVGIRRIWSLFVRPFRIEDDGLTMSGTIRQGKDGCGQ